MFVVSGSLVAMEFLLIHSPLLGPTTWRWVGEELVSRGHEVVVPDLREAALTGEPGGFVDAAVAAVSGSPSTSPGPVPAGWPGFPSSLILLSEAYRGDAEQARTLGWPVLERRGSHLDPINHPAEVARLIEDSIVQALP